MRRRTISFLPASRMGAPPEYFRVSGLDGRVDWSPALDGCRAVVHLAARVHQMHERMEDAVAAYQVVNVDATLSLARQAANFGVQRFIFVSTIKVNGECTDTRRFSADDLPNPKDAYARSKWDAERGLAEIGMQTGMEVVIVRPPLVYGPGVRANFLRLMQLVRSGVPLPLGMVHNQRSLIYVDNLVDFLLRCVDHPRAAGKTWLISDLRDLSTAELVTLIANAMDKPARLLPVPPALLVGVATLLRKDKAMSRLLGSLEVDASPASRCMGWRPLLSVEEGLERTIRHFLSHHP